MRDKDDVIGSSRPTGSLALIGSSAPTGGGGGGGGGGGNGPVSNTTEFGAGFLPPLPQQQQPHPQHTSPSGVARRFDGEFLAAETVNGRGGYDNRRQQQQQQQQPKRNGNSGGNNNAELNSSSSSSSPGLMKSLGARKFGILVILFQIVFIVLLAVFVRYDEDADARSNHTGIEQHPEEQHGQQETTPHGSVQHSNESIEQRLPDYYPMFQDVHVMIFIGFGFLMTFLKRYGYSAVGINFVLAAMCVQWALIVVGFFDIDYSTYTIKINIESLIESDFAAAAVLISMGAMLGKLSPEQYIIMGFIEVVFYAVNEYLVFKVLSATDAGDSMTVHTFGAYFGLTASLLMFRKNNAGHVKEGPVYHSDLFAMIGTIFLWLYWPSFNGALAVGDQRHRAVLNTYISLAACCLMTYAISALVSHDSKFDMVHVQNATLAGGVAVGTSANLMIHPVGAAAIGSAAAILSVAGYKFLTPFMASKLRIHDTCGVHNLHGMPGVLAAIVGAIFCGFASTANYGHTLKAVLPKLVATGLNKNPERTSWEQAGFQFAALGVTLGMAILGGLITGLILRLPIWIQVNERTAYEDDEFWETPHDHHHYIEKGQIYIAKRDSLSGEVELEKLAPGQHRS